MSADDVLALDAEGDEIEVLIPGVDGRAVVLLLFKMVLVELAGLTGEDVKRSLRLTALVDLLLGMLEEIFAESVLVLIVFSLSSLTVLLEGE